MPKSFGQFRFGPEVGVNGSMVSSNYGVSGQTLGASLGLNIGFKAEYSITDTIKLESGLVLNQYGFSASASDGSYANAGIRYLDIPLVAKYYFGSGNTRFYVLAGGYFGYGAFGVSSSKDISTGNVLYRYGSYSFGSKSTDINPLNYGLTAGVGLKTYNYLISLKYSHGLSNVDANTYETDGNKTHFRNLTLSLTYLF